jgi:hypothetical protein
MSKATRNLEKKYQHLRQGLRMHGATPPLHYRPLWRGA